MMPADEPIILPNATAGTPVVLPWERVERFVGQFVHDIRNGLNALELQLAFLGEISTDPEAVEEVKHLRATLADMTRELQAMKTMSSSVVPHVLEYPASDLFEDLRARLERLHPDQARHVSWNVELAPSTVVLVDPDLSIGGLLEIFANGFSVRQFGHPLRRSGRSATCLLHPERKPVSRPHPSARAMGPAAFALDTP